MRTIAAVKTVHACSLAEGALRQLTHGDEPVKLGGLADRWPACSTWSLSAIARDLGETEIQLEVGNVMQDSTELETCRLKDFVSALTTSRQYAPDALPPLRDQRTKYLSVFNLSKHAPRMLEDIECGFFETRRTRVAKVAFIGPALTVTGWHYDWKDNLFIQISGRKIFHLVAPEYSARMYPSRKYDPYSTLSQVSHDPFRDDFDVSRFPAFAAVPLLQADLAAGDALYLPRGYWHHVTALAASISVSVFATTSIRGAVDQLREKIRGALFRSGWRRDNTLMNQT